MTFQTVEQLFPEWPNARVIIDSFIPDRVEFAIRDDRFSIDYAWFSHLVKEAPVTLVEALETRMGYALKLLRGYVEVNNYNQNLKDKLDYSVRNSITLSSLNNSLHSEEFLRQTQGKETILDLYRHALGIKECEVSQYEN